VQQTRRGKKKKKQKGEKETCDLIEKRGGGVHNRASASNADFILGRGGDVRNGRGKQYQRGLGGTHYLLGFLKGMTVGGKSRFNGYSLSREKSSPRKPGRGRNNKRGRKTEIISFGFVLR